MTTEPITLDREHGLTLVLPAAMQVGQSYRGTDETPLAGMDFTLLFIGVPEADLDSRVDQYPVSVQVGAEVWDDVTLPEDAHVILLDPGTGEPMPPAPACQEVSRAGRRHPARVAAMVAVNTGRYEFATLVEVDPEPVAEVTTRATEVAHDDWRAAVVETARPALLAAYAEHADRVGADPDLMAELLDDREAEVLALPPVGTVLRDGEPFHVAPRITPTGPAQ